MFLVELKDGYTFPATSVEENYRVESDGNFHIALTIQNSNAKLENKLAEYKTKFTADNLSEIKVYRDETKGNLVNTYTQYIYIRYLTSRVQPNGSVLYDFNFLQENPAEF